MMRRFALALAAVLACPVIAAAQEQPAAPTRFTISPFVGYAFTYNQTGTVRFTDTKGDYTADYKRSVNGGLMPGATFEYRAAGRFGVAVSGAYNPRGDETLSTDFVEVAPLFSPGGSMWFLSGAVTMELAETSDMRLRQPTGQISIGPALVREVPEVQTGRLASNSFALHAAAEAELPLPWKGFTFRGAIEDYMAYLPTDGVAIQLGRDVSNQLGQAYGTQLSGGTTNLYVVRAGLSYRF